MNLKELEKHVRDAISFFSEVESQEVSVSFEKTPSNQITFRYSNVEIVVRDKILLSSPPNLYTPQSIGFVYNVSPKTFTKILDTHNMVEYKENGILNFTCVNSGQMKIKMKSGSCIDTRKINISLNGNKIDVTNLMLERLDILPFGGSNNKILRLSIIVDKGDILTINYDKEYTIEGGI